MIQTSNTKRLAKNTGLMYIRMILLLCISFYTSRIVLQKLGVTDYGIYNVVGSVVAMFSSLRSIFAMSTQRFLNYEMGLGNYKKLVVVFNTSLVVNILLSIFFIVLIEIIGLWFIYDKMNVPDERFVAAFWAFQISVITSIVSLYNTTFDAEIIAHEKMNFYAYLSILEGILKLLIVYLLSIASYDKLIFYSVLHMLVFLCVFLCNYIYCYRSFEECQLNFKIDKTYLKKMTSFAGWNFIGTNAFVVSQNGLNMILNFFGGPIVNAARGIAYQVNAAVMQFISNVVIVVNPYCIKIYAGGNHSKAMDAIIMTSKLLFTVQMCVSIPLIMLAEPLLELWLGTVPDYSLSFVKLVLLYSIVRSLHPSVDVWFKAVGNIKYYQIFEGVMLLLPIFFSYVLLKKGFAYDSVFILIVLFEIVNLFGIVIIANRISDFSLSKYFNRVLFPCLFILLVSVLIYVVLQSTMFFDFSITSITVTLLFDLFVLLYIYIVGLNGSEKRIINDTLKSIFRHSWTL